MIPKPRSATLAQRALELRALNWPGARITLLSGRELQFRFSISPSAYGRQYECLLRMKPDDRRPLMVVLDPDLVVLAGDRPLPHVYPYAGRGTSLCLWWPKQGEWQPQMELAQTYLAWTSEWLWHFEDWLITEEWSGGGEHPSMQPKRWARPNAQTLTNPGSRRLDGRA